MRKPFSALALGLSAVLGLVTLPSALAQKAPTFTRQDTLRGSITPERAWWDLVQYDLRLKVNPQDSTMNGVNLVRYKVLKPHQTMQIDLQPPMRIERVRQNGQDLAVKQDGNAWFIQLQAKQTPGTLQTVEVIYGGKPQVSTNPPWSGGVTWKKDSNGLPFVATSCQGDGASLWWPCKDHMYDEPDSMMIRVTVPQNLVDVSNGRLRQVEQHEDGTKTYHWAVTNPINNYGVNVNLGDYVHFSETYAGEKGNLDCSYYVLRENLDKAKEQFKQVPQMLKAFEHWFGPYPFYEDGFKLVEVPYLGMEHQSSVTYGNKYQNGYLGRDLSGTGWGLKFDFIIIHESGHEWFANNITYKDAADMWIHESFTNYSENLFVEYYHGKKAGSEYVIGTRRGIRSDRPIIGTYNVNHSGSGDMYSKGGNMLHTLRQVVNDDEKWRKILRGLNKEFYHQTVTTAQIEKYISQKTGRDLTSFFNQYLRDVRIPVLEYKVDGNTLAYRWGNSVKGFNLPVKVMVAGKEQWLQPVAGTWKKTKLPAGAEDLQVDPNFYVTQQRVP
ncbi:M1 family metallopeptidase [Rufibacter glacialis]|uniref:M1 family metallopeptidase n=1 Tax=Rufibacter glacialis TaxID=1259555 RepID=A0A5M8Q709_9BACT|nr:M1 family metallopeptidase [Rufibacter glacialis]KAA6431689.1 M1 family metallopeptidase [Rufibacter glacialis]GGK82419.1 peptidase M1 [Rufibacter glacialis]